MNRVILVGRLTRDPELRTSGSVPYVNFTIAVNRSFTSSTGVREADFINCVAFNRQAENLSRFMRKGSQIGVEGRIQVDTYDAQDGTKRNSVKVVCDQITFLEPKSATAGDYGDAYSPYSDLPPTTRPRPQGPARTPYSDEFQQGGNAPRPTSQNRSPYDDEFTRYERPKNKEKANNDDMMGQYGFDDDDDLPF